MLRSSMSEITSVRWLNSLSFSYLSDSGETKPAQPLEIDRLQDGRIQRTPHDCLSKQLLVSELRGQLLVDQAGVLPEGQIQVISKSSVTAQCIKPHPLTGGGSSSLAEVSRYAHIASFRVSAQHQGLRADESGYQGGIHRDAFITAADNQILGLRLERSTASIWW